MSHRRLLGISARYALGVLLLCASHPVGAEPTLCGKALVHFCSPEEGAQVLTVEDDFVRHLSPFDRSARLKTAAEVSGTEYLQFVRQSVLAWSEEEKRGLEAVVAQLGLKLEPYALPLPARINFIKTSGSEEGQAFYTRQTAVIFPKTAAFNDSALLEKTIAHELFHIISRQNAALRERLYQTIGFEKCPEVLGPPELRGRKITNPDAPRDDHFIRLHHGAAEVRAVPFIFSKSEHYDPARGGEFFNYLDFAFLVLPQAENADGNGRKDLLRPNEVSGFFEKVGRNTDYIIHPEEILADNFALLILGKNDVPSPEILQKMRAVLTEKPRP